MSRLRLRIRAQEPAPRISVVSDRSPRAYTIEVRGRPGIGVQATYRHTQSGAAATWTVNHDLGRWPSIGVYSPGGVEVEASVLHTSLNQAVIAFNQPQTGFAVCS